MATVSGSTVTFKYQCDGFKPKTKQSLQYCQAGQHKPIMPSDDQKTTIFIVPNHHPHFTKVSERAAHRVVQRDQLVCRHQHVVVEQHWLVRRTALPRGQQGIQKDRNRTHVERKARIKLNHNH